MERIKLDLFMDEKRNLFVRDEKGTEYLFWALGFGVPVSLMVETEDEREAANKKHDDAIREDAARYRAREAECQPWYRKLLSKPKV